MRERSEILGSLNSSQTDYHPCIMIFVPEHSGAMYYLWIYDGQAPSLAFYCVPVKRMQKRGKSGENVRMADLEEEDE